MFETKWGKMLVFIGDNSFLNPTCTLGKSYLGYLNAMVFNPTFFLSVKNQLAKCTAYWILLPSQVVPEQNATNILYVSVQSTTKIRSYNIVNHISSLDVVLKEDDDAC